MSSNNQNVQFIFSGVPGNYIFEQNPESIMDIVPLQQSKLFRTIEGEDVRQVHFFDNTVRSMNWPKTTRAIYNSLKNFSTRDSNDNIPSTYFWDGPMLEAYGLEIDVLDVHGTPIGGDFDSWQVELQYKPVADFEKYYRLRMTSEGSPAAAGTSVFYVPNETYNIQFFTDMFEPIITGTMKTFDSSTNTYSVNFNTSLQPIPVTTQSSAKYAIAYKNGWVVGKTQLVSGYFPGSVFRLY